MSATDVPGLQNERTDLAWQRTAVSLIAGAALLGRLHFDVLGVWALACLAPVLVMGWWVLREGRSRYRRARTIAPERSRDGLAGALLAAMLLLLALTQVAGVVLR